MRKNFAGEPFCVEQNFCYRKTLLIGEGDGRNLTTFYEKILSHSAETFVKEPFCVRIFLASKNVKDKTSGGYNDFSSKVFLSHSTKSFRRGDLLCLRKFQLWKKFMPWRGLSRFSLESFLSQSAEKLPRGTLCLVTIFEYQKRLCFRGL